MDELRLGHGPVVVLAPHADDESLGCGLLLASLWKEGGRAHVACLTDGAASHPRSRAVPPARMRGLRREELGRAVGLLGGRDRDVTFFDLPDAAAHRVHGPGEDPARRLAALVDRLGAATLVAPSPLDPHCDHEAGAAAARRVAERRPGLRLLFYPVWSRWHARGGRPPTPSGARTLAWGRGPRHDKRAAIHAHRSQMGQVVRDDPDGFTLSPRHREAMLTPTERYWLQ